jgi:hypothetical protein
MLKLSPDQSIGYHNAWVLIPETGRKIEALKQQREILLENAMNSPQLNDVGRAQALEFLVKAKATNECIKILLEPVK